MENFRMAMCERSDKMSDIDIVQGKIEHIQFNIHVGFNKRILKVKARYSMDRSVNGSLFLDTRDIEIHHPITVAQIENILEEVEL
jgi:hypothetical protein